MCGGVVVQTAEPPDQGGTPSVLQYTACTYVHLACCNIQLVLTWDLACCNIQLVLTCT